MTNATDDIDIDEEIDDEAEAKGNVPKVLRRQIAKQKKELEETRAQLATLSSRIRKADVADALKVHGAPEKLSKYFTGDDTSPESVLAWLTENGEDFGWEPPTSEDEDEDQTNARLVSNASANARTAPSGSVAAQLARLQDKSKSAKELGLI